MASPSQVPNLSKVTFRISWNSSLGVCFGTGCFVDKSGLALTAFHNLRGYFTAQENRDPNLPVKANFQGKDIELRWHLPIDDFDHPTAASGKGEHTWQCDLDIAVLKAVDVELPDEDLFDLLVFEKGTSQEARSQVWRDEEIVIYGFPAFRAGKTGTALQCEFWEHAIEEIHLPSEQLVHPRTSQGSVHGEVLSMQRKRWIPTETLAGISGGPIYSRRHHGIIGIQIAGQNEPAFLYGREFFQLAALWPKFLELDRVRILSPAAGPPPPEGGPGMKRIPPLVIVAFTLASILLAVIGGSLYEPNADRPGTTTAEPAQFDAPNLSPSGPMFLEFSLYRLSPADKASSNLELRDTAGGEDSYWDAELADPEEVFPDGSLVRMTVESPYDGYLYVISRELHSNAEAGPAYLIYPSQRLGRGLNQVAAGELVDIPAADDRPPYFRLEQMNAGYEGEEILVFLTPAAVKDVSTTPSGQVIPPELIETWEREWSVPAKIYEDGREPERVVEHPVAEAVDGEITDSKLILYDALPQTWYEIDAMSGAPFLLEIPIRVGGP